ncbi:uncharacterized protein [Procambarus clarkii]|uniref:uncharacterized protein n=1 Tax=Procambarus clarkii TaxID=6728 RepID=UPI0037433A2A
MPLPAPSVPDATSLPRCQMPHLGPPPRCQMPHPRPPSVPDAAPPPTPSVPDATPPPPSVPDAAPPPTPSVPDATPPLGARCHSVVCVAGEALGVSGLQDDSVVENYNLTLECTVQGAPLPQVLWYKDDTLINASRNIRVRTRTRKLRRRKVRRERSSVSTSKAHPRLEMGHPRLEMGHPRLEMGHPRLEMGHPRLEMGHPRQEMGHPRLETGHPRLETGHPRLETGHPWLETGHPRLEMGYPRLEMGHPRLDMEHPRLDKGHPRLGKGHPQLENGHLRLDKGHPRLGKGHPQLENGHLRLDRGHPKLEKGHPRLNKGHPRLENGHPRLDKGHPRLDKGHSRLENGRSFLDIDWPRLDTGHLRVDTGHPLVDTGHPRVDTGHPRVDTGHPRVDMGHPLVHTGHSRVDMARPRRRLARRRLRPQQAQEWAGGGALARRGRRQGPGVREPPRRPMSESGPRNLGRRRRPGASSSKSVSSGSSRDSNSSSSSSSSSSSGSSSDSSSRSSSSGKRGSNKRKQKGPRRPDTGQQKVLVSQLTVRSATEGDAGVYKCVAKSVAGQASAQAMIRVVPPIDPHIFVDDCPNLGYCLNGGTCMMFKIVGELVCQCAEGFKGQRCQEKEVYPTFNRNCQGPLKNIRHSEGRRCPRNQPAALWELLQQSLSLKHKGSPWTTAQLLNWSSTHTGSTYWSRYMGLAPTPRTLLSGNESSAPSQTGPLPTASGLPHTPPSGPLPLLHTTKDPVVLDAILSDLDLSQVTRRRNPLGPHALTWSGAASSPASRTHANLHQLTTPSSPVLRRDEPVAVEEPQLDVLPLSLPHRNHRRHHHHRQHSTKARTQARHTNTQAVHFTQPTTSAWDQKVIEADLDWSSRPPLNTGASPSSVSAPHQEHL